MARQRRFIESVTLLYNLFAAYFMFMRHYLKYIYRCTSVVGHKTVFYESPLLSDITAQSNNAFKAVSFKEHCISTFMSMKYGVSLITFPLK